MDHDQGTFETREDAGDGGAGAFRLWMTALDLAGETEKDWRKFSRNAADRFRDEKSRRGGRFNILYSTMQTIAPAVYNSVPKPDVRRRFNDEDPVGKVAAQVFERVLSHCIDEYDFDVVITAAVHDSLLRGRGVALVEYDPTVGAGGVDYETVRAEHIQWDDFRIGPGKKWGDVPWCAVRYRITREEAVALNKEIGGTVPLDHTEKGSDKDSQDVPEIFKRLTVWKIWDKPKKQVVFIAPSHREGPFAVEDDVLNLRGFYPFPRPMYDITDPSSLIPLVPYEMYRDQAEELDEVSRRIKALVKVLRWRGIRPAQIEELDRLKDAEDGELIPSESASAVLAMAQTGGDMNKAIWLMPIDKLIVIIRELVQHRESIKRVIFEISGIADILRGETNPNETLGAQQLKAQWGTLRMQTRQREIARFSRDLLRIKTEIIGEQFSVDTLRLVSGIELPTPEQKQQAQMALQAAAQSQQPPPDGLEDMLQEPSWDDVKEIMASDSLRSFRVDIETDSTIQADLGLAQKNMTGFVEGLSAFSQAMGPAVQAGIVPLDIVADLLTGFARNFKLGRQAEDALERLGQQARQPQEDLPDPESMKVQADMQFKQQEMQARQQERVEDAQARQAERQQDIQYKQQESVQRLQFEQSKNEMDMNQRAEELAVKREEIGVKKLQGEESLRLERDQYDGTEIGRVHQAAAQELEEIHSEASQLAEAVRQALAIATDTAQQIMALRQDLSEPKQIDVHRKGGRVVGGTVTQGGIQSEIVLN